jgi:hypothetical protein
MCITFSIVCLHMFASFVINIVTVGLPQVDFNHGSTTDLSVLPPFSFYFVPDSFANIKGNPELTEIPSQFISVSSTAVQPHSVSPPPRPHGAAPLTASSSASSPSLDPGCHGGGIFFPVVPTTRNQLNSCKGREGVVFFLLAHITHLLFSASQEERRSLRLHLLPPPAPAQGRSQNFSLPLVYLSITIPPFTLVASLSLSFLGFHFTTLP